jgi:two-component system response regulator
MDTPLRILVAEDELGDILLLKRVFANAGVKTPIHFASDGQEVLDYLQGKPPFENPVEHPLPNLLLLDLHLPIVTGLEILEWLRSQPGLRHLLVVVLSSSNEQEDIQEAYRRGANSYVVKPTDPNKLVSVVERLQNYWLNINATPSTVAVERPLVAV